MSIGPSVGGHDRYERGGSHEPLYLAGIQGDKSQEQEEVFTNPKSKLFSLIGATLYFKKFIDAFVNTAKSLTASVDTEKALVDLAEFKKLLEELAQEDKSHVPEFTQRLSIQWQRICENRSLSESAADISNLIEEIHRFPPGEDHTLGYYLTEHAGQEWIPFPFMHLLHALHEENLASPETAQMGRWIRKLNEILSNFR